MTNTINIQAIFKGTATYGILYLIMFLLTSTTGEFLAGYWGQFVFSPYMTLMYPVAGYVAGKQAISHGIKHGALVGAAVALITAAISIPLMGATWYGESAIGGTLNYLITCIIMCGLGGGVGELHTIKKLQA